MGMCYGTYCDVIDVSNVLFPKQVFSYTKYLKTKMEYLESNAKENYYCWLTDRIKDINYLITL